MERVVSDLVAGHSDRTQLFSVLLQRCVLADDEERDLEIPLGEKMENPRHRDLEIGGEGLPAEVAVGLHIGPLVIEVQRETRNGFARCHLPPIAPDGD
jgi:hypothetical protein